MTPLNRIDFSKAKMGVIRGANRNPVKRGFHFTYSQFRNILACIALRKA